MSVTSPGVLNGNLISKADSDFESAATGNWIANTNCSTPVQSSTQAFSGTHSLAVTSTASGVVDWQYNPKMPVTPGKSYVSSLYLWSPVATSAQLFVVPFNGGTQLTDIGSTVVTLPAATWIPVTIAWTAPATSTGAQLIPQLTATAGGQTFYTDLAFTAKSKVQVLVDWANSPIGSGSTAGSAFSDLTPFVRFDSSVNVTRGRQDAISTVQPGRLTFTADNSAGWLTPQSSNSPWYPGVKLGRRVQFNVADETGAWHTRFDGQVGQLDVDPAITGQEAVALFTCNDVLSYLNRQPQLSCWTVELSQSYGPALHYIMNEPAASQGIRDSSGNNGPTLVPRTYSAPEYPNGVTGTQYTVTNPVITYQSGNDPVEGAVEPTTTGPNIFTPNASPVTSPLPSVLFSATINSSGSNGQLAPVGPSGQFQGKLATPLRASSGNAFTLLGWVWPDVSLANYYAWGYYAEILCLSNSRTGQMLSLECNANNGSILSNSNPAYLATYYPNYLKWQSGVTPFPPTSTSVNSILTGVEGAGPVMVAYVVNGTTVSGYLGGNLYGIGETLQFMGSFTLPSGVSFDSISIGGPIGGGNGWLGNISNVCLYNYALTTSQLTALETVGAHGIMENSTGSAPAYLLGFANLPSFWSGTIDGGTSTTDYVDITGSNVLTVLQSVCAVEHGIYFADATGKINVYDKTRRMGFGSPALTLPAGSYTPGIQPKWTDQYLVNSEALQNERGGSGVVSTNQQSIDDYGEYPNGTVESPQTAPYYSWIGGYLARQVASAGTTELVEQYNNANLSDAGSWDVNTLGQPSMKLASVEVDLLGNGAGQNEYVAPSSVYGLEIGSVIALAESLAWWPNQPESGELFVEGVTESYSTKTATIAFYTSPALQGRAWQPGSSAYGQLDVTARVGISNAAFVEGSNLPVPSYSSTMNLGSGANGFVGAKDQRGLSENLQQVSTPVLLFVQQTINTQSLTSGTSAYLVWDSTGIDTANGMNAYTNGVYVVQQQGWYEIYLTVQTASIGTNTGNRTIWIARNNNGAVQHIAPASTRAVNGAATGVTTSALLYLYQGDAVTGAVLQDSGAAVSTVVTNGGSHMSLRYLGNGSTVN